SISVPFDYSARHPLYTNMRTHLLAKSRVLVVAPSVQEQQAETLQEECSSHWLSRFPSSISQSALQFKLYSNAEAQSLRLPAQCMQHDYLHPSWFLLQYILEHFDELPAYVGFLGTHAQLDPITGYDRLQLLARWKWENLELERTAYMPIQFDAYRCHSTALETVFDGASTWDMRSFHSLWKSTRLPADVPQQLCYQHGGEFLVHRKRVVQYPRQMFSDLLLAACRLGLQQSASVDALWHVLFGINHNAVAPRHALVEHVLAWHDFPFYGTDKLSPADWILTTSELSKQEMHLPSSFEHSAFPWEISPVSITYTDISAAPPSTDRQVHSMNTSSQPTASFTQARNITTALVVAAYKENLAFLDELDTRIPKLVYRMRHPQIAALDMSSVRPEDSIERRNNITDSTLINTRLHYSTGHCLEASSFLMFILQYYNHLPEYITFIHGHRQSWHVKNVTRVINFFNWTYIITNSQSKVEPFFFNINTFKTWKLTDESWSVLAAHWHEVFQGQLVPHTQQPPHPFVYNCCAQFMVHRSAILARPLSYWQHLYKWCRYTTVKPYWAGRIMEWMWGPLMGQKSHKRLHNLYPCGALSDKEDCT
ncbi:MAG: DUF3431 domain-containing protein, partial [Candidatus Micrarchaeaceae archaeon]